MCYTNIYKKCIVYPKKMSWLYLFDIYSTIKMKENIFKTIMNYQIC